MLGVLTGCLALQTITILFLWRKFQTAKSNLTIAVLKNQNLGQENEILREQRDNNITTVADADRVWDAIEATRDNFMPKNTRSDT